MLQAAAVARVDAVAVVLQAAAVARVEAVAVVLQAAAVARVDAVAVVFQAAAVVAAILDPTLNYPEHVVTSRPVR